MINSVILEHINQTLDLSLRKEDILPLNEPSINNHVYKIASQPYIIRIAHSPQDEDEYHKVCCLHNFLRKKGLPVPEIIHDATVLDENKKHSFRIEAFIQGTNLARIKDAQPYIEEYVNLLIKLHKLDCDEINEHIGKCSGFDSAQPWLNYLKTKVEEALKELKEKDTKRAEVWREIEEKLLKHLEQHKKTIKQAPLHFIHGDATLKNFIVDEQTKKISAIIDFDFARLGDIAYEFAGINSITPEIIDKYLEKTNTKKEAFTTRFNIYIPLKKVMIAAALLKKKPEWISDTITEINEVL